MDIDYLLTATRSARKSLDLAAPIDRAEIRDCLRIALQAANGSNQQPWRWLVVCDPGLRAKLAASGVKIESVRAVGYRIFAA